MTSEQIDAYRKRLQETLSKRKPDGSYQSTVERELQELAVEVGASTTTCYVHPTKGREVTVTASTPELAYNIHFALQTASMIDACRTAARNHEIALAAMKETAESQRISKHTMRAAWVAAVAAWAAVILPPVARFVWPMIIRQP
jgi:hypothetical protein